VTVRGQEVPLSEITPGEFLIEGRKQLADSLTGQHQTRPPMLESMKIFLRRKGTGDSNSR
jgi:hypothetical protein